MKNQQRRALFILHEGVGSTIFNSQVLEHVKDMANFNLTIDILSYDTFEKSWELSQKNLQKTIEKHPNIKITLKKAANIYMPFSSVYNLVLLISFLTKHRRKYDFIHARADYTAFLCILAKPFHRLPVYWDCRGDAVDELKDSLSRKGKLVRRIGNVYLVPFSRLSAYINTKFSYGAIFVSRALHALFQDKLRTKRYHIIPCPVSEQKFFFDPVLRAGMRQELNIKDNQVVYLYSGSMIAYQSLADQYKVYKGLLQKENNVIIIATSEPDKARDYFKDLIQDRFIITSVSFDKMNAYYNLADFAFLIREAKQLNFVASPTKHGEYCLTGLPVIMNDTVDQAREFSQAIGNYVAESGMETAMPLPDDVRKDIASRAVSFYSRKILNAKYIDLYGLERK